MNCAKPLKVAVLMGGFGGEREVSLKSGRAVASGLAEAGHQVVPYDVADPTLAGLQRLAPDAVFVALHGKFGEDGTVQQLLEQIGLPYTGSGPQASRLGMDKLAAKRIFVRHSVPTADYFSLAADCPAERAAARADEFGYPVVVKPACGGSSLGVTLVREPRRFGPAVEAARREGGPVLVERLIRGREFTVGVLEGRALPAIETVSAREFFDYEAKYRDERTHYRVPVALLHTVYRRMREAAVRAYEALGCRHMARVDMMYGWDGRLYTLEVNTIPGFTPRSLLPMAAKEAGIEFPRLCDRLVRAAVRDAAGGKRLSA